MKKGKKNRQRKINKRKKGRVQNINCCNQFQKKKYIHFHTYLLINIDIE